MSHSFLAYATTWLALKLSALETETAACLDFDIKQSDYKQLADKNIGVVAWESRGEVLSLMS